MCRSSVDSLRYRHQLARLTVADMRMAKAIPLRNDGKPQMLEILLTAKAERDTLISLSEQEPQADGATPCHRNPC